MNLTPEDLEAVEQRFEAVVQRLLQRPPSTFRMVEAEELAQELGVSRDYVYAHKEELGAMSLGDGPKARLRFNLDEARARLAHRYEWKRPRGRPRKGI